MILYEISWLVWRRKSKNGTNCNQLNLHWDKPWTPYLANVRQLGWHMRTIKLQFLVVRKCARWHFLLAT